MQTEGECQLPKTSEATRQNEAELRFGPCSVPYTLGCGLYNGPGNIRLNFLSLPSFVLGPLPRCQLVASVPGLFLGPAGLSAQLPSWRFQAASCVSPSVFISCLLVSAPVFGYLGDRYSRKAILSFGILLWSGAGLSSSFISYQVGPTSLPSTWDLPYLLPPDPAVSELPSGPSQLRDCTARAGRGAVVQPLSREVIRHALLSLF